MEWFVHDLPDLLDSLPFPSFITIHFSSPFSCVHLQLYSAITPLFYGGIRGWPPTVGFSGKIKTKGQWERFTGREEERKKFPLNNCHL